MNIIDKIRKLKQEKKAIILVHNYQLPEIHDIADYVGDSLGLSITASKTDAEVIVFCGVRFMAETASILCPDKIILMPDINAGCPMADMITAEQLRALKKTKPKAQVLSYVNSPAEVKAESDICCTSGNALKLAESLDHAREIIFVPDKYLADYASKKINRRFIAWNGYCPSHVKILPEDILKQKKIHPRAEVVVHPECTPQVIALADRVFSTEGMRRYARESTVSQIIIGTEIGMLHRLRKENPDKEFYPASELAVCPTMKLITLDKVLCCLEEMKYEVKVPQNIRLNAKKAVDRMLEVV